MSIHRWLAVLVVVAVILSGCSSAANGGPAGSGPSAGPGLSAGAGESSPSATEPPTLGAAEASLRQDDRARAGLANLGPGATELAALMDASGSAALAAEGVLVDPAIAAPVAAAPTVRLVSLTTPGSTIFTPWEFTTTYAERLMTNGVGKTRILNDHDLLPGPTSDSETATSDPVTKQVTVGGNPGTITTTVTATTAFDGSKISMELDFKLHGEIHDANGATILRIESEGKGHIDGDACPDASGIARAHIALSASETYVGAGVSGSAYGLRQDFSADVRIHADDQANLAGIEIVAKAHETSQGGAPAVAGGTSDLTAHDYDAGFTRTLGYDATGGFGTATTSDESASSAQATSLYLGMALFTEFPAKIIAKATETAWRSGMCVRVSPNPNGGDVGKDSKTQVKVTVRQRYEDTELDKPVVATLDSGPKAIDPPGPQPAPATFTYTAGSKDKDLGTVTFKSVSNRGIGKTTVQFSVGGGWSADTVLATGAMLKGQKCNGLDGVWTLVGTIKDAQIDSISTWTVTINGATGAGTYTFKNVVKSLPGFVTTITGTGRAGIALQPDGTLKMTIFGTTVTSTAAGADTIQAYKLPIPDGFFTWTAGGSCP